MTSINNPKARKKELVIQELKDELLIYDLTNHKAYSLNKTLALVWNLCDGNNSVTGICHQMSKKLQQTVSADFIYLALNELKKEHLLANGEEIENKFDGWTRREVIRKVGLTTMIALPMIMGLVAPTAALAASGGAAPGTRLTGPYPNSASPTNSQDCFFGASAMCQSGKATGTCGCTSINAPCTYAITCT